MGLHHGLCHLNLGGAVARGHISLVKMVVTLSIRHKGETQSGTTYNELNQSNLARHEQGETREDAVGNRGALSVLPFSNFGAPEGRRARIENFWEHPGRTQWGNLRENGN